MYFLVWEFIDFTLALTALSPRRGFGGLSPRTKLQLSPPNWNMKRDKLLSNF